MRSIDNQTFKLITEEIVNNIDNIAKVNSNDPFELGKRLAYLEVIAIIKRNLQIAGIDEGIFDLAFDEDERYA